MPPPAPIAPPGGLEAGAAQPADGVAEISPEISPGWGSLATAAALAPLLAHRMLEYLAGRLPPAGWGEACYHLLPPLGMLAAGLLLWRSTPPLPGGRPKAVPGQRGLSIAAGMLLGTLAALANLLSMLAGGGHGAGSVSVVTPGAVALVLHVALLAPLAEEVAFRGLVYRHLRRSMVPVGATVISAAIFAVMHASLGQSVWAFLLGIVAAFAYEQTRSVLTPVLIHGLFNAVPIGVAVVRSRPGDVGPVWLVLLVIAVIFTFAAHSAGRATGQRR